MTACPETLPVHRLIAAAIFGLLLCTSAPAMAQDAATAPGGTTAIAKEHARRLEQMLTAAADYELWRGRDGERRLVRVERPVLRWSNPLRATGDGAVFIWADEDRARRPAAAMCIYGNNAGGVDHEWQSLAAEPLRASYRGATVWQPQTAGLEFHTLAGAAEPIAATPARRLAQMHRLLRDFTATVAKQPRQRELRALTHPIYRYGDQQADLVDGAVFAFAQATDPEILLLLEARRQSAGPAAWHWAASRMSGWHLDLKHHDELVWAVDARGGSDDREPRRVFHKGPE